MNRPGRWVRGHPKVDVWTMGYAVISGHREEAARIARAHQRRTMAV
jgi:hypothetical protein